jgi:membrane-associated phospholipid phosphatase
MAQRTLQPVPAPGSSEARSSTGPSGRDAVGAPAPAVTGAGRRGDEALGVDDRVLAGARRGHDPLEPRPGGRAERLGARFDGHRPVVAWATVEAVGLVVLLVPTVLLGLLMTKVLDGSRIARWDVELPQWFEDHRTAGWNDVTRWGSMLSDTLTVVAILAVIAILLACCKRWAAVAFLIGAPLVESTVFVTTTFLVDRDRPPVEQLDASPPTDSFPSGHVGAATALWLGLAILVFALTRNRWLRGLVVLAAITAPTVVATSRLYRGMHHPSDVLVGVLVGLAALALSLFAVRTARAVDHRRHHRDGGDAAGAPRSAARSSVGPIDEVPS